MTPRGGSLVKRWLERCAASAVFHYGTLAALQAKVLWGIFAHRDLTVGDTASYFRTAEAFSRELSCEIHWSPLYTSYFGSFLWLGDAHFAVTAHRVVIVVLVSLLVYELARRLLPQPMAWLLTAWWILLPTNHETLYEVHLFAVAPLLAIWLWLLRAPGPTRRGVAVASLLLVTVLVRNEYVLTLSVFATLALGYDLRAGNRILRAYGAPLLVALAVILGFYARSTAQFPELSAGLAAKHSLNVSQIYAFGYGQRNPEHRENPWMDYAALLEETFGQARPSLREALVANPRALFDHFLWNVSLVPSGLQLALLGVRAGRHTAAYVPTVRKPGRAWLGTALLLGVWIAGTFAMLGSEREYFSERFRRWRWPCIYILCVCLTAGVVAIVQRPRPSFLFPLSVLSILYTGQCLLALGRARRLAWPAWAGPALILSVLLVAPPYWAQAAGERPVLAYYRALEAHRGLFGSGSMGVAVPGWEDDLAAYLTRGTRPRVLAFPALIPSQETRPEAVSRALDDARVDVLLIDPERIHAEGLRSFLVAPSGWERVDEGAGWVLLHRSGRAGASAAAD